MGACASAQELRPTGSRLILGRYETSADNFDLLNTGGDLLGEGTSSVCYRGVDTQTGVPVAIKVYKDWCHGAAGRQVLFRKFRRQVEVMRELQQPVLHKETSTDHGTAATPESSCWGTSQPLVAPPSELFVQLLDYSTDLDGEPGHDVLDGRLYVVMELGQQSLKEYLDLHRERRQAPSAEAVRSLSRSIVSVVAGLHAAGFVHLDLKPENIMMCGFRMKLIDVDSCTRVGASVSARDSSISFSPVYCAPEWARFVIDPDKQAICVDPSLDVWSVGMTLCELVAMRPCLKAAYFSKKSRHGFYEWLGAMRQAPLPRSISRFDPDFTDLLSSWMLLGDQGDRRTLAQCLSHPFFDGDASSPMCDVRLFEDHDERAFHEAEGKCPDECDGSTTASTVGGP